MLKNSLLKSSIAFERNLPMNYIEEDSRFYKDEVRYKTYNCYLKFVKNARVSSASIVYKNGFLVSETLYSNEYEAYYKSRYLLKQIISCKKVKLDETKNHLLATDYYSAGHFHWMVEALPRLFCVKDISRDFVLLLPDTPYIRKIGLKSLELLDINFQDIVLMQENEFYKADNLYFVSKLSRTGQMHDEVMKEINALFIRNKSRGDKKIYISRSKAKYRKILNEKEFVAMLKNNGFEMILGEELSLVEQVELFSTCKIVLGIHGAGLTNCLFMPPVGTVIELRKREINNGYWHLSDSVGHEYMYFNGLPDSDKSLIGNGCNLSVPLADFEKTVLNNI